MAQEQQYRWGVRITLEYSDGNGRWKAFPPELREAPSEQAARIRHEAALDTIAACARGGSPRYQRLAASELVRLPVGDWETVSVE